MYSEILTTISLCFSLALAGNAHEPQSPAAAKIRNILFLFADDMQAEAIGAFGHPVVKTPVLDRLVHEGFSFRQCYIMGSNVPAVCIPSRAMLWSGRNLWRVPNDLANTTTLPELLRKHGYETFITGKWHNGRPSLARSFSQGKAIFLGGMSDHFKVPVFDYDPTGKYPPKDQRLVEGFSSEVFAEAACHFLDSYRGEKPFFLLTSFTAPHDPRTPPGRYATMYDPTKIPMPPNFLPQHPFDIGVSQIRDELLAASPRNSDEIRQHLADYYGMITHMDSQIGKILSALKESPFAQETLIIFSSDNGLAVGQHGLLGKQNLYEHSIRVPLILVGPGIPHGQSSVPVYLHDLFPTICELLGIAPLGDIDARSLVAIIRGTCTEGRPQLLFAYGAEQRAIRQGPWKFIRYRVGNKETFQLFNLTDDPWELQNLVNDPKHAALCQQLRTLLEEECRLQNDPYAN